jgi:hypothetical protein
LALAAALSDLWAMGTGEVGAGIGPAHSGRTAKPLAFPFEPFVRAAAGMMRDLSAVPSEPGSDEPGLADRRETEDMGALLARAYLVATVSGLRYWQRVAQTYGMHQSRILRSLLSRAADPCVSEGERRVLADEIRTYFREIGDVSAQEARAFQAELEKLAEGVARTALGSQQATDDRRRWRAKP